MFESTMQDKRNEKYSLKVVTASMEFRGKRLSRGWNPWRRGKFEVRRLEESRLQPPTTVDVVHLRLSLLPSRPSIVLLTLPFCARTIALLRRWSGSPDQR